MASIRSAVSSTETVMRFPCGHCEPDGSVGRRTREVGGRALWIACRACNVIALACAPAIGRRRAGKELTARTH